METILTTSGVEPEAVRPFWAYSGEVSGTRAGEAAQFEPARFTRQQMIEACRVLIYYLARPDPEEIGLRESVERVAASVAALPADEHFEPNCS